MLFPKTLPIFLLLTTLTHAKWTLDQMVTTKDQNTRYHAKPLAPSLLNPWPAKLENEFQKRAHKIIQAIARDTRPRANTYFENEKRDYGFLMAHLLGGQREEALKAIQARDHQHEIWHRETDGIDYYACFTIKHQMRKYFYFGDLLDPAYKAQMFSGAKKWTAQDPMRRPHYAFAKKTGWGPDAKNSWVDIRTTENLYLMRTTSVYLMAEETGNSNTAKKYKEQLLRYAATLYRIGIGEWDSENYHGHSITPLLNLYDFAQDLEVKKAAKACLDFYAAAGAVKYFRGGFNGPNKRDYNHAQPFGGSAANALWVWFGAHPTGKKDHWEGDEVHMITSAYRPPLAVVKLARKQIQKPVEIFATKPPYSATTQGKADAKAEYLETQYLAHSYLMGSLTNGTSPDGGDVNGFKILAFDEANGAVALHAAPGINPLFPGSPMYKKGVVPHQNRVAQLENIALWLAQDGKAPWLWVLPPSVKITHKENTTFLQTDQTWIAIRGLGTTKLKYDKPLTSTLADTNLKENRFPGYQVLTARGTSKNFCGLAIEVGEKESHRTFQNFQKSALSAKLDLSDLDQGAVRYQSADGKHLGIHWNDNPLDLGVWRNGTRRDLTNPALYQSPVIQSDPTTGILTISADGETFSTTVDEEGRVN